MALHLEGRWKLLEAFCRDIRSIRNRIEYERIPLAAIIEGLDVSPISPVWNELQRKMYGSGSFASFWEDVLSRRRKTLLSPLKNEDMEILKEFGYRLAEAESVSMQTAQIDMTLERLRECARETKQEIEKKSRLFRILGTMAGFAAVIVLW